MPKVAEHVLMFWPASWGQVQKFQKFWSATHAFDARQQRELAGVSAHFRKALQLLRLAESLRPNLALDRAELEAKGYTPAENAAEVATVLEAAILELYSTVDCTAKVLRALYGSRVGGRKGSTRHLFMGLQEPGADLQVAPVPLEIAVIIAGARWYRRLLHLRDELTHASTGHVHMETNGGIVRYDHHGLTESGKPLSIENVFAWFKDLEQSVNHFIGQVFHHLNVQLADEPVWQICGMVGGRVLYRWVSPVGDLTFDSGECGAYVWFEQAGSSPCPFRERCGAYRNKAPPERFGTGGGPAFRSTGEEE